VICTVYSTQQKKWSGTVKYVKMCVNENENIKQMWDVTDRVCEK
jgi:hypothetical protein